MRHAFLWEMCTGRFIGDNCQIRRPEAISVFGISLNTTCTDRFFFEISGCGVRGGVPPMRHAFWCSLPGTYESD